MPSEPGNAWIASPNENFFIRKFGNDLNLTGKLLRKEEREIEWYSSKLPYFHLHIRDFHRLCNGETIVSPSIIEHKCHKHSISFRFFGQKKDFEDIAR